MTVSDAELAWFIANGYGGTLQDMQRSLFSMGGPVLFKYDANGNVIGLLNRDGSAIYSLLAGLNYSAQPANAYIDLVAPLNGTTYIDNVLTIQNKSVSAGGAHGNAAIRFRDDDLGYERGAMGYGQVWNDTAFGRHMYVEIGNIAQTTDTRDTSFSVVNTHAAGATNFPGTLYRALEIRGDTGNLYLRDHLDVIGLTWLESDHSLNVGTPAVGITTKGAATGNPAAMTAVGTDSSIALRIDDKGGAGVFLGSHGVYSAQFQNPASSVNYNQFKGSATGQAVIWAALGTDSTIDCRVIPKGAAGRLVYGTYVSGTLSPTGYIEIKDDGGTTRRMLVG